MLNTWEKKSVTATGLLKEAFQLVKKYAYKQEQSATTT